MSIAMTLKQYLDKQGIQYELLPHQRTTSSLATARVANVPAGCLAKSVVLEDEDGFVMAILPANNRLELGKLYHLLQRKLGLATEQEVAALFQDCEVGSIPPIGQAYGLEVVVDDSLTEQPDIYCEVGDHRELLHLSRTHFWALLGNATHGHFSHRVT